ncbi:MAG: hypothetical protein QNJ31_04470 [Candidatus Caenarcaniphilales bacterium]|nr:hypothetical protein [Candidatus Caenarcaniphilales bacterium]
MISSIKAVSSNNSNINTKRHPQVMMSYKIQRESSTISNERIRSIINSLSYKQFGQWLLLNTHLRTREPVTEKVLKDHVHSAYTGLRNQIEQFRSI